MKRMLRKKPGSWEKTKPGIGNKMGRERKGRETWREVKKDLRGVQGGGRRGIRHLRLQGRSPRNPKGRYAQGPREGLSGSKQGLGELLGNLK